VAENPTHTTPWVPCWGVRFTFHTGMGQTGYGTVPIVHMTDQSTAPCTLSASMIRFIENLAREEIAKRDMKPADLRLRVTHALILWCDVDPEAP
jgi:hypothetical protein